MSPAKPEHGVADDSSQGDLPVSKSQLKRDAQAMKSLANDLVQLNTAQLQRLPLEKDLLLTIQEAQKMRSHGARRRQLQYAAKLIRRMDSRIITEAMTGFQAEAKELTGRQHRSEAWRETLLERGDLALSELLQHHPGVDVQAMRQLIRNAQSERIAGKPPTASRALFRLLRDLDTNQALPPCP